jgi:hypothetical protein
MFLDIIHLLFLSKHRPVYIPKDNVSETGFCLRLQVKPTQLGRIDIASPCLFLTIEELLETMFSMQSLPTARPRQVSYLYDGSQPITT